MIYGKNATIENGVVKGTFNAFGKKRDILRELFLSTGQGAVNTRKCASEMIYTDTDAFFKAFEKKLEETGEGDMSIEEYYKFLEDFTSEKEDGKNAETDACSANDGK